VAGRGDFPGARVRAVAALAAAFLEMGEVQQEQGA
jgi:hypothetical protein